MKITIINTTFSELARFPPVGSLSIIKYLRKNGLEAEFINVDYYRYNVDQTLDKIIENGTEILGISAVTSTTYRFVKDLSIKFKALKPNSLIVLGGNMAASAEIVLNKTKIDICALGEGEKVFYNIVKKAMNTRDLMEYADIPGIVFNDDNGKMINTGYEKYIDEEDMYEVDLSDFKETTPFYIADVFDKNGEVLYPYFKYDKRTYEPHRKNKTFFNLMIGKGCVARCTFCHRWDKGIKHIPVKVLMKRLDELIEKYNVGFLLPYMESVGSDKKWFEEFCYELKKRDILWYVGSVRARSVNEQMVHMMKDCGCTTIFYGLETGSEKMLSVMEKKTSLQDNINAHQWTVDVGFYTTLIQLVLAMPGENSSTVKETLKFTSNCYTLNKNLNPLIFSINFAQALPGTPLYEYGRRVGLIGTSVNEEEKYLLYVSDKDASAVESMLNFTEFPMGIVLSWKYIIYCGTVSAFVKKFGVMQLVNNHHNTSSLRRKRSKKDDLIFKSKTAYRIILYVILYKLRFFLPIFVLLKDYKKLGRRKTLNYFVELFLYILKLKRNKRETSFDKSLRKIVKDDLPSITSDIPEMEPLRKGR